MELYCNTICIHLKLIIVYIKFNFLALLFQIRLSVTNKLFYQICCALKTLNRVMYVNNVYRGNHLFHLYFLYFLQKGTERNRKIKYLIENKKCVKCHLFTWRHGLSFFRLLSPLSRVCFFLFVPHVSPPPLPPHYCALFFDKLENLKSRQAVVHK